MLQYSVQITSFLNRIYSNMMRAIMALLCAIASPLVLADSALPDVTDIPFEQLLQTEFIPANRIANQVSNASSAVSIVTAQDIKDYGYRTLADILNSMRGLQTPQDYVYSYLGGRGFSSPGDYAGRIIVLIDGYRADDSYYGQAYLGNDGILDVALIDRVEYIPGGGAVGYGDGALLGAINIITKNGDDINGAQMSAGYGSHQSHQERFTFGKTLKNGANILLSASTYSSKGRGFNVLDSSTETLVHKASENGEDNKRLFFKGAYEGLTLQAAWAKRNIEYPSTLADLSAKVITDDNAYIRLKYDTDIARHTKLSTSVWYGQYLYRSVSNDSFGSYLFEDNARWHGVDAKLVGTWFDGHTVSLGVEYRHDFQWDSFFKYSSIDVVSSFVDPSSIDARKTNSFYAYDDFTLNSKLSFNFGARYETNNAGLYNFSPRGAVIWRPHDNTVFKLSQGTSHRQATANEGAGKYFERADTTELVWEQALAWQTKLLATAYRYRIDKSKLSEWTLADIVTRGVEVEFERVWEQGTRLRASYALQDAQDVTGTSLINAPHNIAKFNLSTPLMGERLRAGLEVRHIGSRLATKPTVHTVSAHTVADLTLSSRHLLPNLDASLTVRNLFDKEYGDVTFRALDRGPLFAKDGRNFWLNLEYNFK
jgi:iron complex outermembrane receptor protein